MVKVILIPLLSCRKMPSASSPRAQGRKVAKMGSGTYRDRLKGFACVLYSRNLDHVFSCISVAAAADDHLGPRSVLSPIGFRLCHTTRGIRGESTELVLKGKTEVAWTRFRQSRIG